MNEELMKALKEHVESARWWLEAAKPYCHHSNAAHAVGEALVRLDRIDTVMALTALKAEHDAEADHTNRAIIDCKMQKLGAV